GLTYFLGSQYGEAEAFPHPHNVYLEWLLDNGIIGFIPVILFYGIVVVTGASLFRDTNPWCAAAGGIALSLVLVQLIAGIGSQHFYPGESTLGMWVAIFMALRVRIERAMVVAGAGGRELETADSERAGGSCRVRAELPACDR
ncbi:MAG: hypothetical protein HQ546_05030, partial [Planctomycetes bacterium]|nr:hypothetical protein [Planctomycetota bacterium]